jgi:hypothetical protein
VLLQDFIKPLPDHTLLDISVYDNGEGKCFGAIVKDLTKKTFKKYLTFEITYACPELTSLSYACTNRPEKACILIDLEEKK